MSTITVNGKDYNSDDFTGTNGYGYTDPVVAGTGDTLPRHLAALIDAVADAARARITTSATSKNAGLTGSQDWVLAADISFTKGSWVIVASAANPTVNWYVIQVTNYVSGTKTLTGTVQESLGSASSITDWVLMPTGKPGATGATGASLASGHGQCRLTKSSSNLLLSPCNGNYLNIDGTFETVPSAGVTLAPTSLSVDTTYYIYAYMNSGTMTLEASATAPAVDSATGVMTKTGDTTRTLVGMARTITGPAWEDSESKRYVLSYFNRRNLSGSAAFTTNRSTTSGTFVELNSEIRNQFLTWADEAVLITANGRVTVATSGQGFVTAIGIDDANNEDSYSGGSAATNNQLLPFAMQLMMTLSAGHHYATLIGLAGAAGSTWEGAGGGAQRCTLKTVIRG